MSPLAWLLRHFCEVHGTTQEIGVRHQCYANCDDDVVGERMTGRMHLTHSERGFTLAELLVVLLILGGLASVAVLAITHFLGKGTVEAANTEAHQIRVAISWCMQEAGTSQLDMGAPVNWDGRDDVITATSSGGVVHDASDSLRGNHLKATYTVTPSGEIAGVTSQEWSGITWVDDHWEK